MGRKVSIEELRIDIHGEAVDIVWQRAGQYPAPLRRELTWTRVGNWRWMPDEPLPSLVEQFAGSAHRAHESGGAYHRVSLRLDDRLEPRFAELADKLPWSLTPGALPPDAPLIVWRGLPSSRTDLPKRTPESRLPLHVDLLQADQDTLASEPFVHNAIQRGVVEVRLVEDASRRGAPLPEGDILHVADFYYVDDVRRHLRGSGRLPRILIQEEHYWPLRTAPSFAEAVLAEGCQAFVFVVKGRNEPSPSPFARALYRKLLHDLPLDLAIQEAVREAHGQSSNVFLAALEGAEAVPLLSQSVLDQRYAGDLRLRDVLLWAERRIPESTTAREGELSRFLTRQRQATQARSRELEDHLDTLTFSNELGSVEQILRLQERARETVAEWQRLQSADTLVTRGSRRGPLTFESYSTAEEERLELPLRLTNVWLTRQPGQERVPDQMPLTLGVGYALNVQIGFVRGGVRALGAFPIQQLADAFKQADEVPLEVIAFAKDDEISLEVKRVGIRLPRFGESGTAVLPFVPKVREGSAPVRRIRLGIYHQNRLLQSVSADLAVAAGHTTLLQLDFVASDELLLVDELPPVAASFFLNEGPEGSHWIGYTGQGMEDPVVLDLDPEQVRRRVEELRKQYDLAQGTKHHLYGEPLEPGSDNWHRRADALVALAKLGRKIYFNFITGHGALSKQQKTALENALRAPDGLIQIARCRESAPGVPWGTIYDHPLDRDEQATLHLCEVFESQLRENVETQKRQDLLDKPAVCRARQDCPLEQENAGEVVCPFGFWGIRHRIEQPTHAVKPSTLTQGAAGQLPRARWASADKVRAEPSFAVAHWAFDNTPQHVDALRKLAWEKHHGEVTTADTKATVKTLLQTRRAGIIYFYCHGDELDGSFALRVGRDGAPFKLDADTLSQWKLDWPQAPLVVLNGCETLAVRPDQVHDFLVVLRDQGASGVVGPEVPVWTSVSSRIGEGLIERFLSGQPLGHALQAVQRELLRELNPMGLMYVAYARADLEFVLTWREPGVPHPPGIVLE